MNPLKLRSIKWMSAKIATNSSRMSNNFARLSQIAPEPGNAFQSAGNL